ncbi:MULTISPECIES: YlxR family protein [Streptomyces]|uniref:YlxR family protein n=1 Tax=Streptomyces fildesensis TaxID=375757 RepID=A0ABW8BXK5_9ACTN|nr:MULTISPECIES: YlxR family protein [Streptomyces]MCM2421982.1 YlxR family protein [Streptomyces sp. RKAG293]MCM2425818.1 YlxR family protein [Streptomyces sp. RKAG337]MCZ4100225.1 YlxR family protein [Streptomyces sp. H39-C1]MCZ4122522.1 YlxR family protein [Streptomyces sp. H39-S7]QNA75672.1 YlxR family protein [Streptomyces sp. So13.3]
MSGRTRSLACPERTCVGCRERVAKNDLLRVAVSGDACVPDPRGTLPGRGAHLHPDLVCFDLAVRRRAFSRAFRSKETFDTAELRRYVEQNTKPVEVAAP